MSVAPAGAAGAARSRVRRRRRRRARPPCRSGRPGRCRGRSRGRSPCAAATRLATGVACAPSGTSTGRGVRRPGAARVGSARLRGGLRAVRAGAHAADHLADGHGVAGLGEDLGHRAARGRGDLGVDLVGGDLDDRLVGLDRVADLLGPLEHVALGDRLAHLRHDDVDDLGLGRGSGSRPRGLAAAARRRSWARSRPARRRRGPCRPRRRGPSRRCRRSARGPRRRPCRSRSRRASRRPRRSRPPPCAIPARCPR